MQQLKYTVMDPVRCCGQPYSVTHRCYSFPRRNAKAHFTKLAG